MDLEKLSRDGSVPMTGAMKFDRGVANLKSYKDVLHFYQSGVSVVGALKIKMPKGFSDTMLKFTINGFDYTNKKSWNLNLSCRNHGGTGFFDALTAKVDGDCPFSKVRFAYDGTSCCVLLGDLSTEWSFPTINISELLALYNNIDDWGSYWSASIITSETGITNVTEAELKGTVPKETYITTGFPSGWGGFISARKNNEQLKTIQFTLSKTTDITTGSVVLYTLPFELRPYRNVIERATLHDPSGNLIGEGYINILADGNVILYANGTLTNARWINCSTDFY